MKITIVAVGKSGRSAEQELIERYLKRLNWKLEIIEVDDRGKSNAIEQKQAEAKKILTVVPQGSLIIALDERGKSLTSPEFAEKIGGWQSAGNSSFCFIIGGADGLDKSVTKNAQFTLNFGRLTWPHMLVRAMLVEQIYRASTILSGHPYHKT